MGTESKDYAGSSVRTYVYHKTVITLGLYFYSLASCVEETEHGTVGEGFEGSAEQGDKEPRSRFDALLHVCNVCVYVCMYVCMAG